MKFCCLVLLTLNLCFLTWAYSLPLTVISPFSFFDESYNKNDRQNTIRNKDVVISLNEENIIEDGISKKTMDNVLNYRPIIGILSEELTTKMNDDFGHLNYTSYIAASYVKFVEAAGARVVPVMISQNDEYYEYLGKTLNGFLFPGGSLYFDSEFSKAAKKIYDIVTQRNSKQDQQLALWATCLGFENLIYFMAGVNPITTCKANNVANNLQFQDGYEDSKLFKNISQEILKDLATKNITSNFHHNCVLPQTFEALGLNKSCQILSTSVDEKGVEYISTVEHRELPIFGTQWHPEKPMFEWSDAPHHNNIPHSIEAVRAAQALVQVFVQYARLNSNHFTSKKEENARLIYNYVPTYVGLDGYPFEMCYFF